MRRTAVHLLWLALLLNGCGDSDSQQRFREKAKAPPSDRSIAEEVERGQGTGEGEVLPGGNSPETQDHVVVTVTGDQMAVIKSLPEGLVCVTSAKSPVKTLAGLKDEEFYVWGFSPSVPAKLMAAFGRKNTAVGLGYVGLGNDCASFEKTPHLRLYITDERSAEILEGRGRVRIEFRLESK